MILAIIPVIFIDLGVRPLRSEHFNYFDRNVWHFQSVDILLLYIKSNLLRLHWGTIMLQTISKLEFGCNISTILSNWNNWFCSRKLTPLLQGRKMRNIDVEQEKFRAGEKFLKNVEIFQHVWSSRYLVESWKKLFGFFFFFFYNNDDHILKTNN